MLLREAIKLAFLWATRRTTLIFTIKNIISKLVNILTLFYIHFAINLINKSLSFHGKHKIVWVTPNFWTLVSILPAPRLNSTRWRWTTSARWGNWRPRWAATAPPRRARSRTPRSWGWRWRAWRRSTCWGWRTSRPGTRSKPPFSPRSGKTSARAFGRPPSSWPRAAAAAASGSRRRRPPASCRRRSGGWRRRRSSGRSGTGARSGWGSGCSWRRRRWRSIGLCGRRRRGATRRPRGRWRRSWGRRRTGCRPRRRSATLPMMHLCVNERPEPNAQARAVAFERNSLNAVSFFQVKDDNDVSEEKMKLKQNIEGFDE